MKDVIPQKSASFAIKATGSKPWCYSWEWKPTGTEGEGEWQALPTTEVERYQGADTDTLTIASVQMSDQGSYRCVVRNVAGTKISQPATLTVGMLICIGLASYVNGILPS